MTQVLLITDTDRVQRIFDSLEKKGEVRLRTAATLDQADLEIAAEVPEFTFVQSRVSGFSGEILLRHLKKVLPKGAKTLLLSADAADAALAKKERRACVDLSLDDEALEESVRQAMLPPAAGASRKKAAGEETPAPAKGRKPAKAKTKAKEAEKPVPEDMTVALAPALDGSAAMAPVAEDVAPTGDAAFIEPAETAGSEEGQAVGEERALAVEPESDLPLELAAEPEAGEALELAHEPETRERDDAQEAAAAATDSDPPVEPLQGASATEPATFDAPETAASPEEPGGAAELPADTDFADDSQESDTPTFRTPTEKRLRELFAAVPGEVAAPEVVSASVDSFFQEEEASPAEEELPPSAPAAEAGGEAEAFVPEAFPGTEDTAESAPAASQKVEAAAVDDAPAADPPPSEAKAGISSFAEMLDLGEAKAPPASPLAASVEVEDRVNLAASPPASAETAAGPGKSFQEVAAEPFPEVFSEGLVKGVPLADAMAHAQKKKRPPLWILPVVAVCVLVPLVSYLVGKQNAPLHFAAVSTAGSRTAKHGVQATSPSAAIAPKNSTPVGRPAPQVALNAATAAPQASAVSNPTATGATPQTTGAATAGKQAASPGAGQPVQPGRQAAPPEAKGQVAANPAPGPAETKPGVKSLPPAMAKAKLDSSYGNKHPGWQRYVDDKAEYMVFKENDAFRALQVVALGKESVTGQLFKRLLFEFGGGKRFVLQSTSDKGDYVMERGVGTGGVSLTIYRKKKDLKVKGLVLYYQ